MGEALRSAGEKAIALGVEGRLVTIEGRPQFVIGARELDHIRLQMDRMKAMVKELDGKGRSAAEEAEKRRAEAEARAKAAERNVRAALERAAAAEDRLAAMRDAGAMLAGGADGPELLRRLQASEARAAAAELRARAAEEGPVVAAKAAVDAAMSVSATDLSAALADMASAASRREVERVLNELRNSIVSHGERIDGARESRKENAAPFSALLHALSAFHRSHADGARRAPPALASTLLPRSAHRAAREGASGARPRAERARGCGGPDSGAAQRGAPQWPSPVYHNAHFVPFSVLTDVLCCWVCGAAALRGPYLSPDPASHRFAPLRTFVRRLAQLSTQAELASQNAMLLEKRHETERARLSQELQAAREAARAGGGGGGGIPPGMTVIDEAAQAQMEAERKRVFLRMEKRVAHLTSQLASLTQKAARDAAQSAMRCVAVRLEL